MIAKQKQEIKYVVDSCQYVKINEQKIESFINEIPNFNYRHWSNNINLSLSEEKWILLAFLLESMNFCFWQKPKWEIKHNNQLISGSNALFYSFTESIKKNPSILNIDYLYNLSKEDFYKIFTSDQLKISLINERFENFREVVNIIYHDKNFYNQLYTINSDIELLNFIITNFSSFDDKSLYKGQVIHFNKRATLLVNDLFNLSVKIKSNIKNVYNLSGCADYGVPRVLRDYGILEYSDELKKLVDNEKNILHDSEMEIEIRASMLYVIELIKKKLREKDIIISSVELDNIIWLVYKNGKVNKSLPHHTVTIYY